MTEHAGECQDIPTIRIHEFANENDQTRDCTALNLVQLYQNERASTVRIEHRQISIQQAPGGTERITTIDDGTGFFVSRAGQVITDLHVVNDDLPNCQSTLMVHTADGATYEANVVDKDTGHDLALLNLTAPPQAEYTHAVQFAESSQFSSPVGLSATGHPLGWQTTFLSPGTYLGSTLPSGPELQSGLKNRRLLKLNMHVEQGNSGSPIFDAQAQMVGVIESSSLFGSNLDPRNIPNVATATPVEDVRSFLQQSRYFRP
jgi:S1-C subfamily serine protease